MPSTQRRRFRLIDLYQEIEWATPIGQVTFFECHGKWFYKVDASATTGYVWTSGEWNSAEECMKALNEYIKWGI